MSQIIGIMSQALDASSLRQKAISNNIANADTPNYKPQRVSFEDMLQQEIHSSFSGKRTNVKHIAIGNGSTIPSPKLVNEHTVMRNNRNGVDLDFEMTEMSKNSLWYQSLAYGMNEEFNLLKMSIKGRG
ncbi:flagellar basal body rod protein FlgB [Neobacillus sp. NPDC093127]|uniref:flagellar basal body rod protein FlgB n=1 Tax=Neobacillus sp. NPDC093127 TaxID=3364296 RepID=UPI003802DEA4